MDNASVSPSEFLALKTLPPLLVKNQKITRSSDFTGVMPHGQLGQLSPPFPSAMMTTQLIYALQINTLKPYSVPVQSYRTQVNMTCGFESETLDNRLVSRDAVCSSYCWTSSIVLIRQLSIVSSHHGLSAHSFLHKLLKQLEAIKFASDWKRKGREPGGRVYKKAFARSIYFARTGLQPPSGDDSTEDQKKIKTFKAQQQTLITNRNHLLDMYNQVLFSTCSL
jgi:hypothetical protein